MSRISVTAIQSIITAAVVGILLFVTGFVVTVGDHSIPKTVTEDPSLPRVELNGTVFHAEAFGDPSRPAIIVVHGGPGGDYRALLPLKALSDRFYVVFYDQRGSGLSPRVPSVQLVLDTFVADLDAMVDHFGQGQAVHLIGHSWGGALSAIYTARHPEKVDRMVLAEPAPLTPSMDAASDVVDGATPDLRILISGTRFWLQSLHLDDHDDHTRGDYLFTHMALRSNPGHHCEDGMVSPDTAMWRMGRLVVGEMRQSLLDANGDLRSDLIDGIEDYTEEILFLVADCSSLIGPVLQEHQMTLFQNARMVTIEDAGHMMFTDQPETSIAAIQTFLEADT